MTGSLQLRQSDDTEPRIISHDEVEQIRRFARSMEVEIGTSIVTGSIDDLRCAFEMHTRPSHTPEDVAVRHTVGRVMRRLANVNHPESPAIASEPIWLRPAFELLRQTGCVTQEVWELLMIERPANGIDTSPDAETIAFPEPDNHNEPPRSA